MHLLALDWRKAFDFLNTEGLIRALQRFGLPYHLLGIVRAITRTMKVKEWGGVSLAQKQNAVGLTNFSFSCS